MLVTFGVGGFVDHSPLNLPDLLLSVVVSSVYHSSSMKNKEFHSYPLSVKVKDS